MSCCRSFGVALKRDGKYLEQGPPSWCPCHVKGNCEQQPRFAIMSSAVLMAAIRADLKGKSKEGHRTRNMRSSSSCSGRMVHYRNRSQVPATSVKFEERKKTTMDDSDKLTDGGHGDADDRRDVHLAEIFLHPTSTPADPSGRFGETRNLQSFLRTNCATFSVPRGRMFRLDPELTFLQT